MFIWFYLQGLGVLKMYFSSGKSVKTWQYIYIHIYYILWKNPKRNCMTIERNSVAQTPLFSIMVFQALLWWSNEQYYNQRIKFKKLICDSLRGPSSIVSHGEATHVDETLSMCVAWRLNKKIKYGGTPTGTHAGFFQQRAFSITAAWPWPWPCAAMDRP